MFHFHCHPEYIERYALNGLFKFYITDISNITIITEKKMAGPSDTIQNYLHNVLKNAITNNVCLISTKKI